MVKPGPEPGVIRLKKDGTPAKRMGRPPKSASKTDSSSQAVTKRRGRPPKSAAKSKTDSAPDTVAPPKRRGRAAKKQSSPQQQQKEQQQQESEQAQSSQVFPQDAIVLEVVGTSIQPAFVIQQHGVNSPDLTGAHEATDTADDKPEGILSKLPSKKDVATAKKLAVKKTQAMKKTASKKVSCELSNCLHTTTKLEVNPCLSCPQCQSLKVSQWFWTLLSDTPLLCMFYQQYRKWCC